MYLGLSAYIGQGKLGQNIDITSRIYTRQYIFFPFRKLKRTLFLQKFSGMFFGCVRHVWVYKIMK